MKKLLLSILVVCVGVGMLSEVALSGRGNEEAEGFQIIISPHTIALDSTTVWLTVHTNVPLGAVDCSTLELDGIPVRWTKADSLGYLVAKFSMAAVKEIVAPPETTLTLTGLLKDGTPIADSDTVRVKD